MSTEVKDVPLSKVRPDPKQPRTYFDEVRLAELAKSINKHGIMNPLIVEPVGDGYMLIDGERRYRAATNLNLKHVPVLVRPSQGETERLIEQFHLQEQHEGWSAVEKANGLAQLAGQMNLSVKETGEMLGLTPRVITTYMAFSKIINHEQYQQQNISLQFAAGIVNLRSYVKSQWLKNGVEFTDAMEGKLEQAIMRRIKSGAITKLSDMVKIHDSVKADYKSVTKYIEGDTTEDALFISSNAKGAYHGRNVLSTLNAIVYHQRELFKTKDGVSLFKEETRARDRINEAIVSLQKLKAEL